MLHCVPQSAVLSVGFLWGASTGTRTCGVFVGHLRALAGARFAADRWHASDTGRTNEWAAANISLYLDGLLKQGPVVRVARGEYSASD